MTTLNPPKAIRVALYLLLGIGTPVVAYLNDKAVIGATEVTLWSALAPFIGGLAVLNAKTATEATVAVTAPAEGRRHARSR